MSQLKIKDSNDQWIDIPASGVGVPSGGTGGQVLVKSSNVDYATQWLDPIMYGLYTANPVDVSVATAYQSGGIIHLVKSGKLVRCYSDYSGAAYSQSANTNAVIGQIPEGYRPVKTLYAVAIGRSGTRIEANAVFAFVGRDAGTGQTYGNIEFNPNAGAADFWFFDCVWITDE